MNALIRLSALMIFILATVNLFSQETTATLNGIVTDRKGEIVPGATVSLTHQPTGYRTSTQTNNKGLFVIPNLKPGGPYTIVISFVGFDEQKFENINLSLGNNPEMNIALKTKESTLQEVVVNATGRRTIAGLSINRAQMNI
ncbi:MAG TPA: carboxypeptidase-like regulatory domain-containing protein, partial [Chitinophagaceae bacterium]|nr:carboxypeptidase-like regulatory domain-containing protein [Chitinophagaceae bacterium]